MLEEKTLPFTKGKGRKALFAFGFVLQLLRMRGLYSVTTIYMLQV